MKYILDTHTLLWWLFDSPRLSTAARKLVADPSNTIFASSASAWEIATKHRLGKLPEAQVLAQDLGGWFRRPGFVELSVSVAHAQRAGSWPQPHREPFDRMIAAQSVIESLPVIGCDKALQTFGVRQVW